MKRLLILGLLSLAAVTACAQNAGAWFHCCCRHRCCTYTTRITVRPYNAFSPVMCGKIAVDGCMPINPWGGQFSAMMPSVFGGYACGPGCFTSGCCDAGSLPAPGKVTPAPPGQGLPSQPVPDPGPQFTPPSPQPLNQSTYWMPMQSAMAYSYGYGHAAVQPADYQPVANPYYPMTPASYAAPQVPAYWYGR
jgi:hypothetical protein